MATITTQLRVTSLKVQPFAYKDGKGEMVGGESLELRAAGFWQDENSCGGDCFPVSLHCTVYPGHPIVPAIGDCVTVTIAEQETPPSSISIIPDAVSVFVENDIISSCVSIDPSGNVAFK